LKQIRCESIKQQNQKPKINKTTMLQEKRKNHGKGSQETTTFYLDV
jgi:hypothetical protein